MPARKEILDVAGREVAVSNPDKIYFPKAGYTTFLAGAELDHAQDILA